MKILVTGSNGYIGQHLCKLLSNDHEVYGLDMQDKSTNNFVIDYYQVDITKKINIYIKFDTVIHLAALVRVGESVERPLDYYKTNVIGTLNVLYDLKFDNFIFGSTGAAATPTSPYATSKLIAEDIVKKYLDEEKLPWTIFRFYNVTGTEGFAATNPDGLFFKLNEAVETGEFNIYGNDYDTHDGTAVRDYVHVNEICHALIEAIDQPSNQIENLGHGKGYSVLEIATTFQKVNNVQFNINMKERRAGDPPKNILDNVSKYMKELYTLEDYLKI